MKSNIKILQFHSKTADFSPSIGYNFLFDAPKKANLVPFERGDYGELNKIISLNHFMIE